MHARDHACRSGQYHGMQDIACTHWIVIGSTYVSGWLTSACSDRVIASCESWSVENTGFWQRPAHMPRHTSLNHPQP